MKYVLTISVLAALAAAAFAAVPPMVPYGATAVPSGPMVPNSGLMVPNAAGGSSPPPTCSNSLDFTQACNSQYVGVF